MPRKRRWIGLGAALVALLALATLAWFPPTRPGVGVPSADSAGLMLEASRGGSPAETIGQVAWCGGFREFSVAPPVPRKEKPAVLLGP